MFHQLSNVKQPTQGCQEGEEDEHLQLISSCHFSVLSEIYDDVSQMLNG